MPSLWDMAMIYDFTITEICLIVCRMSKHVNCHINEQWNSFAVSRSTHTVTALTAQPFSPPPLQHPLLVKRQHPLATIDKSKEPLLLATRRAGQRGQSEEPARVSRFYRCQRGQSEMFRWSRRPWSCIPGFKVYSPNAAEYVKQRCPDPNVQISNS